MQDRVDALEGTLAITSALAFGYESLGVFIASRFLAALVIGGAVTLVMAFIDIMLAEMLATDSAYGRRIAAVFGLSPRGLDLIATLASALQRLFLSGFAGELAGGWIADKWLASGGSPTNGWHPADPLIV